MNHHGSNGDGMKHLLLMMACCLIPIAGILAISVFGLSFGSLGALLPFAMVLICPIMMFFMMRSMAGGQGATADPHHHGVANQNRAPVLGAKAATELERAEGELPRCH